MGWLANYRWLSSLREQDLPPVDHAKRAATKAERRVAKRVRKHPAVLHVHHAVRLTKIEGGKGRREVDLIVVMKDRILLIEVKHFNGKITMNDRGVLHQNGINRGWSFSKLDDASKRLRDTMQLAGIHVEKMEIHSILVISGKASVEDSVSTGGRLMDAHIAKNTDDLMKILKRPAGPEAVFGKKQLKAIRTFFDHCGTWDSLVANNGAQREGDVRSSVFVDGWRERFQKLVFKNERGWWASLLFGPLFRAHATDWNGKHTVLDVRPQQEIELIAAGGKSAAYRFDHLSSLSFGYRTFPDWAGMKLMKARKQTNSPSKKLEGGGLNQPPYRKGDVVRSATVSNVDERYGVFFTLDAQNSGLYRKDRMEQAEWDMREGVYRVGNSMPVKVLKVKRKGPSGWNIEVVSED